MANDTYTPTCATDCNEQVLAAVGNTNTPSNTSVELAEINILHLDEVDPLVPGSPKNPITGYVADADNEAVILTWRGLHDNTAPSKVRTFVGTGEKPEPTSNTITLHKGITYEPGTARRTLIYTISIYDDATNDALRKIEACKGTYHAWFANDTYLRGGEAGITVDIEKCVHVMTGGRGDVGKWVLTLGWNAKASTVRDLLPYSVTGC